MEAGSVRQEVHFSGHVQGVGFRYTTRMISQQFEVYGNVRNLPDGRVQLIAEGSASNVTGFVAAVREKMDGFIREVEMAESKPTGEFKGFEIA